MPICQRCKQRIMATESQSVVPQYDERGKIVEDYHYHFNCYYGEDEICLCCGQEK